MMGILKKIGNFFKAVGRFFAKASYSVARFFVLTFREMKKVRWPSKEQMKEASKIVLSFVFIFGLYVILGDYIIANLLKLINY